MDRRRFIQTGAELATLSLVSGCAEKKGSDITSISKPFVSKLGQLRVGNRQESGLYVLEPNIALIEKTFPLHVAQYDIPIIIDNMNIVVAAMRTPSAMSMKFRISNTRIIEAAFFSIRTQDLINMEELFIAWIQGKITDVNYLLNDGKRLIPQDLEYS